MRLHSLAMKVLYLLATLGLASAGPIVKVEQGLLEGVVARSVTGVLYSAFSGIPFARPPIGALRFMPPQPPKPWSEIRQATKEGNVCYQVLGPPHGNRCPKLLARTLQIQSCTPTHPTEGEDCLYLNVYTRKLTFSSATKLRPVLVWIYGGGFLVGSGNIPNYGPDFLLQEDVVIVTFNYRLGAFGFMALKHTKITGNMGMKDQVMALKWVQKNIEMFGGDPKKVTIFGESAGGMSVNAHLLSKMSRGLFRSAISQSGNSLDSLGFSREAHNISGELAALLLCDLTLNRVKCLQHCSAWVINLAANVLLLSPLVHFTYVLPFGPTAEPVDAVDAFLTKEPIEYYENGEVADVPYITGVNSEEAYAFYPLFTINSKYMKDIWNWPPAFIPDNLDPKKYNSTILVREIREFYFGTQDVLNATLKQYMELVKDLGFFLGDRETLKWHAKMNKAFTYSYEFAFSGKWDFGKISVGLGNWSGAAHGDDINYLWYEGLQNLTSDDLSSAEYLTSRRMVKMWTNFAETGDPTSDLSYGLIPWPPYTSDNHNCLKIDTELTIMPELEANSTIFWDGIYKLYGNN